MSEWVDSIASVSEVTSLLAAGGQTDPRPANELLTLVYDELRRLAAQKMAAESAAHTLQPTALVHEAWLRLGGSDSPSRFQNRAHFFAAAAEAMRRILIDRARSRRAVRNGGAFQRLALHEMDIPSPSNDDDTLLALNDALECYAREHRIGAELVALRYFVGMTIEEAADALDISPRTARNYWTHARAWLFRELQVK